MSREAAVSDYFQKSERRHPAAILIEQAVSSQLWASDVHTWVVKGTPGTEKRKRSSWILTEGALPFLSLACSPPFFFLLFRHDEGVGLGRVPVCSITSLCFITVFVLFKNMCVTLSIQGSCVLCAVWCITVRDGAHCNVKWDKPWL